MMLHGTFKAQVRGVLQGQVIQFSWLVVILCQQILTIVYVGTSIPVVVTDVEI